MSNRTYTQRYDWGNAAHFWPDNQDSKIVGWSPRCPVEGDLFKYRDKDGNEVTRTIVSVERAGNPHDMWFATLNDAAPVACEVVPVNDRTPEEMQAQWLAKFDEERTPERWAEFCAGMGVDGLRRAFAKQAEHIWSTATRCLELRDEQEAKEVSVDEA